MSMRGQPILLSPLEVRDAPLSEYQEAGEPLSFDEVVVGDRALPYEEYWERQSLVERRRRKRLQQEALSEQMDTEAQSRRWHFDDWSHSDAPDHHGELDLSGPGGILILRW